MSRNSGGSQLGRNARKEGPAEEKEIKFEIALLSWDSLKYLLCRSAVTLELVREGNKGGTRAELAKVTSHSPSREAPRLQISSSSWKREEFAFKQTGTM